MPSVLDWRRHRDHQPGQRWCCAGVHPRDQTGADLSRLQIRAVLTGHPDVWVTTGREIAEYYIEHYYDSSCLDINEKLERHHESR